MVGWYWQFRVSLLWGGGRGGGVWAAGHALPHSSSPSPTGNRVGLFWTIFNSRTVVILPSRVIARTAFYKYSASRKMVMGSGWLNLYLCCDATIFIKFISWLRNRFTKHLWKAMDYLKYIISLVRIWNSFIFQ